MDKWSKRIGNWLSNLIVFLAGWYGGADGWHWSFYIMAGALLIVLALYGALTFPWSKSA